MQWYYAKQGQRFGPIEDAELHRLADEGHIRPDDLVWNESMGDQWAAAASVPGLFAGPPPVPPPGAPQPPSAPSPVTPEISPQVDTSSQQLTHNRELMRHARASLRGNWGFAVGVTLLVVLINVVAAMVPLVGPLVSLVISGPMTVGVCCVFLLLARRSSAGVGHLFHGFSKFGTALGAYLLATIFVMLWMLLLIIPGIIAAYAYAMTFFIIADDPTVGSLEAITRSKLMMRGRKWKLFCLGLRFIGWILLGVLTLGIGMLWVWPYLNTSLAHFYDDVRPRVSGQQYGAESVLSGANA